MGVYRTGRTHRNQFSRFGMRPSSLKAGRTQKPLKKSKTLLKLLVLGRFFGSSCSKTWWSHSKPRKSNSMGSPRSVDLHGHPGVVLIAEILSDQMFVLIFLCHERSLVNLFINVKMINRVWYVDFNIENKQFCDFCGKKSKIATSINRFTSWFE